ncbi:hypothetical protein E2562_038808 [Oryza meyeriana var. granulata]|uniref:Uncharacterized protein n=1 Tax=Oryza meyeriana var. granulata TaxID=110450 RepID=A0A6G1FH53_9ORYZ|nr:hypothetical protein E2562_038808 [Oryza meyeriana var. granulata]
MAEVEREHSALYAEGIKGIAVREEATKALRELEGQWEALTVLKMRVEESELELARCEAAATEQEEAATQCEGIPHTA